MTPLVEALVAKAFHRAALADANSAIEDARRLRATGASTAISYEIAVPALGVDEFLTHKALPKLVYFLNCRGFLPAKTPGLFVSLFLPEGLFCIDAGEVATTLGRHRGLSDADLVRRFGAEGTGDPLQLGTGA